MHLNKFPSKTKFVKKKQLFKNKFASWGTPAQYEQLVTTNHGPKKRRNLKYKHY